MRATEAIPGVVYDVSVNDGEHWNRLLYAPNSAEDPSPWWWEEEDIWIGVVDDAEIKEVFNPHQLVEEWGWREHEGYEVPVDSENVARSMGDDCDCGLHETVVRLVTEWKKVKNDG